MVDEEDRKTFERRFGDLIKRKPQRNQDPVSVDQGGLAFPRQTRLKKKEEAKKLTKGCTNRFSPLKSFLAIVSSSFDFPRFASSHFFFLSSISASVSSGKGFNGPVGLQALKGLFLDLAQLNTIDNLSNTSSSNSPFSSDFGVGRSTSIPPPPPCSSRGQTRAERSTPLFEGENDPSAVRRFRSATTVRGGRSIFVREGFAPCELLTNLDGRRPTRISAVEVYKRAEGG